ncbi:MAG: hypothetical protein Q8P97_02330 [bacterium]|nr:hypothetical protein [bacterium]
MFRKYNKKIFTAILVVIVGVGLIGPGALFIFTNIFEPRYPEPPQRELQTANPEEIYDTSLPTSTVSREVGGN